MINVLYYTRMMFNCIFPCALKRNVKLHKTSKLSKGCRLTNVEISNYSYCGQNCYIDSTTIGKFTSISDNCRIGGASHPLNWGSTSPVFIEGFNIFFTNLQKFKYESYKETTIGNDVWIGSNSIILSGIKIDNGCVIGAGSVVTKDCYPYGIYAGNPAKRIGDRFPEEIIKKLTDIEWWNFKTHEIKIVTKNINDIDCFIKDCETIHNNKV